MIILMTKHHIVVVQRIKILYTANNTNGIDRKIDRRQ